MHCAAALLSFVVRGIWPPVGVCIAIHRVRVPLHGGGDDQDELFKYRLFVPEAAEPAPLDRVAARAWRKHPATMSTICAGSTG